LTNWSRLILVSLSMVVGSVQGPKLPLFSLTWLFLKTMVTAELPLV